MKKIKIVIDSTSDLSKELLDRYEITVLPLHIHLGEAQYLEADAAAVRRFWLAVR